MSSQGIAAAWNPKSYAAGSVLISEGITIASSSFRIALAGFKADYLPATAVSFEDNVVPLEPVAFLLIDELVANISEDVADAFPEDFAENFDVYSG